MSKDLHCEQPETALTDRVAAEEACTPQEEWTKFKVKLIESISPGELIEIELPASVDHLDFMAELGLPERDYEIGGIFNTKTRSMVIVRGAGAKDRGMSNPQVEFIRPRRNPDQSTDDIFFHTHPWDKEAIIRHYRDPNNACEPSDNDTNKVLSIRMIEEEAGQDTKVVSIVSSGGYITKTEALGINIDVEELIRMGVSKSVVREILIALALVPPAYLVNYAKDEKSGQLMMEELEAFYLAKKSNPEILFTQKLRELKEKIKTYCDEGYVNGLYQNMSTRVINAIERHFPKFLSPRALDQLGLNTDQISLIKKMIGLTIKKYRKTESGVMMIGEIA